MSKLNDIRKQLKEMEQVAEKLGLHDDAWPQRADALKWWADASGVQDSVLMLWNGVLNI